MGSAVQRAMAVRVRRHKLVGEAGLPPRLEQGNNGPMGWWSGTRSLLVRASVFCEDTLSPCLSRQRPDVYAYPDESIGEAAGHSTVYNFLFPIGEILFLIHVYC